MADPLLLLREVISTQLKVTLLLIVDDRREEVFSLSACTHLSFPPCSLSPTSTLLPKSCPTRYTAVEPTEANPVVDTFDLQCLLNAYMEREAGMAEYLRNASAAGVRFISAVERRVVVEWLSGKSALEGPAKRLLPSAGEEIPVVVAPEEGARAAGAQETTTEPVAKKIKYTVVKSDQELVRKLVNAMDGPRYGYQMGEGRPEIDSHQYKTRATMLRGDRTNNFDSARAIVLPRLNIARAEEKKREGKPGAGVIATSAGPAKVGRKKQLNPIILISPSSSALITMHNVKRFLEDSIFEKSEDVRRGDGTAGRIAEDMVLVNHARTTSSISSSLSHTGEVKKTRYFVVDSVEALSKFGGHDEAWDRVVCVMTTGQEWQFNSYKWKEPKELFHHVKGIFLQQVNEPPNEKVRSWNVTELRIDLAKRHIDKSTVADFWRTLEAWIQANKPNLL